MMTETTTKKRGILFDLDGTLVDTAPDLINALNVALASENLSPMNHSSIRFLVGRGIRVLLNRALSHLNHSVSDQRRDELESIVLGTYQNNLATLSQPYPGVISSLKQLRMSGYVLGVCTNKPGRLAVELLKSLDMDQYFEAICGGDTFDVKKPDPGHVHQTLLACGKELKGSAFVGDSDNDLLAARAAGLPCILVTFGYSDVAVRTLNPDATIDHFDVLANTIENVAI